MQQRTRLNKNCCLDYHLVNTNLSTIFKAKHRSQRGRLGTIKSQNLPSHHSHHSQCLPLYPHQRSTPWWNSSDRVSKWNRDGCGDTFCYTLQQITNDVCVRLYVLPGSDCSTQELIKGDLNWLTLFFPKPPTYIRQHSLHGPPMGLGNTNMDVAPKEVGVQVEIVDSDFIYNPKVSG